MNENDSLKLLETLAVEKGCLSADKVAAIYTNKGNASINKND